MAEHMTSAQLVEWGEKEAEIRKAELRDFHTGLMELKTVQANAATRRREAGLSRNDASFAVSEAQRKQRA